MQWEFTEYPAANELVLEKVLKTDNTLLWKRFSSESYDPVSLPPELLPPPIVMYDVYQIMLNRIKNTIVYLDKNQCYKMTYCVNDWGILRSQVENKNV